MIRPSAAIPVTTPRAGLYADNMPSGVVTPADRPLITAVTIASTIAPPTWFDVLNSPEASPCSWSGTPDVAWMFSAGNAIAKPSPISMIVGNTVAKYADSGPIRSESYLTTASFIGADATLFKPFEIRQLLDTLQGFERR